MSTTCWECSGEGKVACDRCHGRGGRWAHRYQPTDFSYRNFDFRNQWEVCSELECESGRVPCPSCGGTGDELAAG